MQGGQRLELLFQEVQIPFSLLSLQGAQDRYVTAWDNTAPACSAQGCAPAMEWPGHSLQSLLTRQPQ